MTASSTVTWTKSVCVGVVGLGGGAVGSGSVGVTGSVGVGSGEFSGVEEASVCVGDGDGSGSLLQGKMSVKNHIPKNTASNATTAATGISIFIRFLFPPEAVGGVGG